MTTTASNPPYRVQVVADSSGEYAGNGLTFETPAKAAEYARNLMARWTLVTKWRVLDVADTVVDQGGW